MRRRPGRHGKIRDAEGCSVLRRQHARGLEQVRVSSGHVGDGVGRTVFAGPHRRADRRTGRVLYVGSALRQSHVEKRYCKRDIVSDAIWYKTIYYLRIMLANTMSICCDTTIM